MNYFIQASSEKEYIKQANQQLKPMGMILDEKKFYEFITKWMEKYTKPEN